MRSLRLAGGVVTWLVAALVAGRATRFTASLTDGALAQGSSCGNAVIEGTEQCDPPGALQCPPGSPAGAFLLCRSNCTCPSPLHHFQCYEIRPPGAFSRSGVNLDDSFSISTVDIDKAFGVCAPADKNGEDPDAPNDPGHLTSYGIRSATPFAKLLTQRVVNQFGTVFVDLVKPARLLVPTAKSLAGPTGPIPPSLDHFQCYKVRRSRGTPRFTKILGVNFATQLETSTVDLVKPLRLCVPVDKNGETPGAETHEDELLCYRVRAAGPLATTSVLLNNQFGAQTYQLSQRREFCVPSQRPCGNGTVDAGEQCELGADSACPGLCGVGCECSLTGEDDCFERTQLEHNVVRRFDQNGQPRKDADDADPELISWDEELAKIAEKWASQCMFKHNPEQRGKLGENIAAFKGHLCDGLPGSLGENAVLEWRKEESNYDRATGNCIDGTAPADGMGKCVDPATNDAFCRLEACLSTDPVKRAACECVSQGDVCKTVPPTGKDCCVKKECGHFTQIVWSSTREVGCGKGHCPKESSPLTPKDLWTNVVCNYKPKGNTGGKAY